MRNTKKVVKCVVYIATTLGGAVGVGGMLFAEKPWWERVMFPYGLTVMALAIASAVAYAILERRYPTPVPAAKETADDGEFVLDLLFCGLPVAVGGAVVVPYLLLLSHPQAVRDAVCWVLCSCK